MRCSSGNFLYPVRMSNMRCSFALSWESLWIWVVFCLVGSGCASTPLKKGQKAVVAPSKTRKKNSQSPPKTLQQKKEHPSKSSTTDLFSRLRRRAMAPIRPDILRKVLGIDEETAREWTQILLKTELYGRKQWWDPPAGDFEMVIYNIGGRGFFGNSKTKMFAPYCLYIIQLYDEMVKGGPTLGNGLHFIIQKAASRAFEAIGVYWEDFPFVWNYLLHFDPKDRGWFIGCIPEDEPEEQKQGEKLVPPPPKFTGQLIKGMAKTSLDKLVPFLVRQLKSGDRKRQDLAVKILRHVPARYWPAAREPLVRIFAQFAMDKTFRKQYIEMMQHVAYILRKIGVKQIRLPNGKILRFIEEG